MADVSKEGGVIQTLSEIEWGPSEITKGLIAIVVGFVALRLVWRGAISPPSLRKKKD